MAYERICTSLHEGVTFSIHFLICTGSTLFINNTLVARRMRLRLAHCASAKRMRIHDNILRTRCMNVIVYGCARFYN